MRDWFPRHHDSTPVVLQHRTNVELGQRELTDSEGGCGGHITFMLNLRDRNQFGINNVKEDTHSFVVRSVGMSILRWTDVRLCDMSNR
jgi:hypothetical protein